MIDPFLLRTIMRECETEQGLPGKEVKMTAFDNSSYLVKVGKAQAELALFLKANMGIKNMQRSKADRLIHLIDAFGEEKMNEADKHASELRGE